MSAFDGRTQRFFLSDDDGTRHVVVPIESKNEMKNQFAIIGNARLVVDGGPDEPGDPLEATLCFGEAVITAITCYDCRSRPIDIQQACALAKLERLCDFLGITYKSVSESPVADYKSENCLL